MRRAKVAQRIEIGSGCSGVKAEKYGFFDAVESEKLCRFRRYNSDATRSGGIEMEKKMGEWGGMAFCPFWILIQLF